MKSRTPKTNRTFFRSPVARGIAVTALLLTVSYFGSQLYAESSLERWTSTVNRADYRLVDSSQTPTMYFATFVSPESELVVCYKFLDNSSARTTSLEFKDQSGQSHDPVKTTPLTRTTWYGPVRYQHLDGHAYTFAGTPSPLTVNLNSHNHSNSQYIELQPTGQGTNYTVTVDLDPAS